MPLSPGVRLGPYEIDSPLGAGGMGEVYRARDTRLERLVAIKVLPERLHSDPTALARFADEAKALAALSHPNILALHDFRSEGGVSFAVMELLEGETLRARLVASAMPWRRALALAVEIAEGLAAAHAKGLVHRDLKPENVFVTSDGRVKILDFGLARFTPTLADGVSTSPTATARTRPGGVVGTPGYLSPEQIRGAEAHPPSDLFALGCVLYEMVAGRRAFTGRTAEETMASILHEEPADPTEAGREVPPAVVAVIRHCLVKNPEERYQSARDLALGLRAILERGPRKPPGRRRARSIGSLAILPFANASADPQAEYLSDGITESLIYSLSRLPELRVMARATVFRYKGRDLDPREIGRELDVRAVLTGSVVKRGETLVIHTELVDADDGSQLWGERYNRKLSEILTIEEQISAEISEKLRLRLTKEERRKLTRRSTESAEAYQHYLKGRFHWNRRTEDGLRKGIEFFRLALAADPAYAPAYVGLADSHSILGFYGLVRPTDCFPGARAAAERALEIDPGMSEAHASLAYVQHYHEWDWDAAAAGFRRAIELNPNYATAHQWYSIHLATRKRSFDEAVAEMSRARALDPLSLIINAALGWLLCFCRRYDEAAEQCRRTLEMDAHFPQAHLWLGWALVQQGRFDEAIAEFHEGATSLGGRAGMLASLGHAYAASGREGDARRVLDEISELSRQRYVSPYEIALVHAGLGESERALDLLEQAFEDRSVGLAFLDVEPRLDVVRSDARFAALLRRIGLGA